MCEATKMMTHATIAVDLSGPKPQEHKYAGPRRTADRRRAPTPCGGNYSPQKVLHRTRVNRIVSKADGRHKHAPEIDTCNRRNRGHRAQGTPLSSHALARTLTSPSCRINKGRREKQGSESARPTEQTQQRHDVAPHSSRVQKHGNHRVGNIESISHTSMKRTCTKTAL